MKSFLLGNCPKNYFQRSEAFGWGGGVDTFTIGFTNGQRLITWKNPAEDFLELRDVVLNSGWRGSVKRLGDAIQND